MPATYHSIAVRWVGLEGLSCEELLQRFSDKQRRRIYSNHVLGLDASGNALETLDGLDAYTQLLSLSLAKCKLETLESTVSFWSSSHLQLGSCSPGGWSASLDTCFALRCFLQPCVI